MNKPQSKLNANAAPFQKARSSSNTSTWHVRAADSNIVAEPAVEQAASQVVDSTLKQRCVAFSLAGNDGSLVSDARTAAMEAIAEQILQAAPCLGSQTAASGKGRSAIGPAVQRLGAYHMQECGPDAAVDKEQEDMHLQHCSYAAQQYDAPGFGASHLNAQTAQPKRHPAGGMLQRSCNAAVPPTSFAAAQRQTVELPQASKAAKSKKSNTKSKANAIMAEASDDNPFAEGAAGQGNAGNVQLPDLLLDMDRPWRRSGKTITKAAGKAKGRTGK